MPKPIDDIKSLQSALWKTSPAGAALDAASKAGKAIQDAAAPVVKAVKSADATATKAVDDFVSRTRKRMGY